MKNIYKYIMILVLALLVFNTKGQTTLLSETFESASTGALSAGSDLSGWRLFQTTGSANNWTISTASGVITGAKSLIVSNDAGTTAAYTNSDNCDKVAYYNTLLNASSYIDLKLNFKWKCTGETTYDYFKIVYSTNGTTWNDVVSTVYSAQSATQTVTNLDISSLDGTSFYLGFKWVNDGSLGSNPSGIIDDISLVGTSGSVSTIGSSGGSDYYAAFGSYYGYQRSANLYTSAEIGNTNLSIKKLYFNVQTASGGAFPVKIYLLNTAVSSISADTWANMIASATLVYNASPDFSTTGWFVIDITDFNYTTNNLMVLCESNLSGYGSDVGKFYYSAASNMHGVLYGEPTAPSGNLTINSNRADIKFTYTVSTKAEPTNHATSFTVGTTAQTSIPLTWTDATGAVIPDGYLIKWSSVGYGSITAPSDLTAEADAAGVKNVAAGVQSASITGLSANTTYYFKIWPYTNSSTTIDYKTAVTVPTASGTTLKIEPTNQATSLAKGTVTTSNIPLTWTAAVAGSQAPDGYLIKVATSAPSDPVDGTDPANDLDVTGGGNAEITPGSATSYSSFTTFAAGTMYYFKSYSYTNSGTGINFNTTSPISMNAATLPNVVASATVTGATATSSTIAWSAPSGYDAANNTTLVFIKATSAVTQGTPSSAPGTYTANTAITSGTGYQNDASAYCVYKGDGTSVTVTGLTTGATYHVLIYTLVDVANSDATRAYSAAVAASGTTLKGEPSNHATAFTTGSVAPTTIALSWTDASAGTAPDGYLLKWSATSYVAITAPSDGTAEADAAGVLNIAQGVQSASASGLTPNTTYYFKLWPYTNTSTNINYYTGGTVPTASTATLDGPTAEGYAVSGTITNNGTLIQTDDANYLSMSGTTQQITGTGTFTDVKLNVNGTITFDETMSGAFTKTYINTAKSLTIATGKTYTNGSMINLGTNAIAGSGIENNTGAYTNLGTLTIVTGTVDVDGTFDATGGTVTFSDAGNLYLSGATITSLGTFTPSTGTVHYDRSAGDQSVLAVTYNNLTISGGSSRVKTLLGTTTVGGDLSVASTTTLAMSDKIINVAGAATIPGTTTISTGTLNVDGTFDATGGAITASGAAAINLAGATITSLGTFTYATSTVTLDGAGQAFPVATLYNLTSAGSGTKTLGGAVVVRNTLNFSADSKIATGANTLTIGIMGSANGSITGYTSARYIMAYDNGGVIGYVKRFVNSNTAYVYPIGDATRYTPMTFTLNSNGGLTNADLTVYNKASKLTGLNAALTTYINRFWDYVPTGITSANYDLTMVYADADIVGTEANLLPIKKSGTTWYAPTESTLLTSVTKQGNGSVTTGTNTLTWTGLTTFSGGSGAGDQGASLPVSLLSFNANCNEYNVDLDWKTAAELNNNYFTVERSYNLEEWSLVGNMNSQGNSNSIQSYNLVDNTVDFNNSNIYYRLSQTDIDGKFEVFAPISLSCNDKESFEIIGVEKSGASIAITYNGIIDESMTIMLYSVTGQQLYSKNIISKKGTNVYYITDIEVATGVYMLMFETTDKAVSKKVLLK